MTFACETWIWCVFSRWSITLFLPVGFVQFDFHRTCIFCKNSCRASAVIEKFVQIYYLLVLSQTSQIPPATQHRAPQCALKPHFLSEWKVLGPVSDAVGLLCAGQLWRSCLPANCGLSLQKVWSLWGSWSLSEVFRIFDCTWVGWLIDKREVRAFVILYYFTLCIFHIMNGYQQRDKLPS